MDRERDMMMVQQQQTTNYVQQWKLEGKEKIFFCYSLETIATIFLLSHSAFYYFVLQCNALLLL